MFAEIVNRVTSLNQNRKLSDLRPMHSIKVSELLTKSLTLEIIALASTWQA
jgi:hypothetical protein